MKATQDTTWNRLDRLLFTQIDNTGLILFRVAFGALIAIQSFGEIATGWLKKTIIDPLFTFNFIGFDFLQPLPGNWMYVYNILMGVFGLLVMVGYKYRFSMFSYALMWTCLYLMQKTSYNNHYYLMMLLCWLMVFLPANRWFSVDARQNTSIKSACMPRWVLLIIILQIWIVYTYASLAKLYPDWLDTTVVETFMSGKKDYWLIGALLQQKWVHWIIAYVGIFFDLLVVPLLLWKRTRLGVFIFSIFFHLANSFIFLIGIFPYMSIAFAFFFFSSKTLRNRFLPKKEHYTTAAIKVPSYKKPMLIILAIYFTVQIGLPLRHWAFTDDVLWTEEGHRLSWRMMLRSKTGSLRILVEDKNTGIRKAYDYKKLLSAKQQRSVRAKPDLIWQLAQRIKKIEAEKGRDVRVFVKSKVSINNGPYYPFIDPDVDLANEPWHHFKHHDWILPSPENYHEKPRK